MSDQSRSKESDRGLLPCDGDHRFLRMINGCLVSDVLFVKFLLSPRVSRFTGSCENFVDDSGLFNTGEAVVEPLEPVGEPFMVNSQQM